MMGWGKFSGPASEDSGELFRNRTFLFPRKAMRKDYGYASD
jgi:hypothetical protein